jgi:mono/diheme cytochrome c family protein/nitrate reductase NapE component
MYKSIFYTHYTVVTLFLLIYVVKTILLLSNKEDLLVRFTKKVKVPEMIVSFLFLATGIFLLTQLSFGSKYDFLMWIKLAMVLISIPVAVIGFKRRNKILAALSLLLIVASYGVAEAYHGKRNKAAGNITNEGEMNGLALYEANCKLCHGNDGKLGASGAADLGATILDANGIKDVILHGKGMMQPVTAVNEDQAKAIAGYVMADIKGK